MSHEYKIYIVHEPERAWFYYLDENGIPAQRKSCSSGDTISWVTLGDYAADVSFRGQHPFEGPNGQIDVPARGKSKDKKIKKIEKQQVFKYSVTVAGRTDDPDLIVPP